MARKWRLRQIREWAIGRQKEILRGQEHPERRINPFGGFCQMNIDGQSRIPGEKIFFTTERSRYGHYGHTVKVVAPRGTKRAIAVDVTQKRWNVGDVGSISDEGGIIGVLESLFGVGGWQRKR